MPDPHPFSPAPFNQTGSTRLSILLYRVGLLLILTGNILVIAAFFSPWFDVFKLDDPSFVFPKREYSPWMALQIGQLGSLLVVTRVYLLLILGMALSSLTLALTHTARIRFLAATTACILALTGLALTLVAIPGIQFDLSFSWPFLSSTVVYGASVAAAGFVSVLIGLIAFTSTGQGDRQYSGAFQR